MKATVKVEKEVDFIYLNAKVNIRYWEDSVINGVEDTHGTLTPCRVGDLWCPTINIDTGIITNWTQGVVAEIHFKVNDEGSYYLIDSEDKIVLSIEGDYVPKMMSPKENGYGDYIIMDVDENGQIADWKLTLDGFINED